MLSVFCRAVHEENKTREISVRKEGKKFRIRHEKISLDGNFFSALSFRLEGKRRGSRALFDMNNYFPTLSVCECYAGWSDKCSEKPQRNVSELIVA